jgi:hypothetical protein
LPDSALESKDPVRETPENQRGVLGSLNFLERVLKKSIFTVTYSNIKE